MTLHVSLPKELETLVHKEVQTGMYGSASEVVREALRGFFSGTQERELRDISEIKMEVRESLRRYDVGEDKAIDGEQFFENMKIKYGLDD